jgi:hypothetical protein
MTNFNIPRHERTPETEVDVLLTNLSVLYSGLHPDAPPHEFINTYFKEMYKRECEFIPGDALALDNEIKNSSKVHGISKVSDEAALGISCAYCVQALEAYDDGALNEAWTFIVDARFWCSISMSRHSGIAELKQLERKEAVSAIRRISRKKGIEEYDYSEFVLNMYRSRPWKNKTQAMTAINKELNKYLETNNIKVRTLKSVNERGEVVETKQSDFCKYIWGKLPEKDQVKKDSEQFEI